MCTYMYVYVYMQARADGINPKGLVVINPGNPVGSVLGYDDLRELVKFCKQEVYVYIFTFIFTYTCIYICTNIPAYVLGSDVLGDLDQYYKLEARICVYMCKSMLYALYICLRPCLCVH